MLAILGVAGLILTGCTPSEEPETTSGSSSSSTSPSAESESEAESEPAEADQSVQEACTVLIDGVSEMQSSLSGNAAELQADPVAAAAAYDEVVALFQTNAAQVTNADVKPAADRIGEVFVTFGDTMHAAATDPESVDPQAITDYTADLQEASAQLDEVCGG